MAGVRIVKKSSMLGLLVLFALAGQNTSFAQYGLEKVKELKINSLYPVELVDFYPQEGLFLGYINKFSKGLEVALLSEDGEIIVHKNLHGEGPEQYVSTLNGIGFSNEGDIWVQTPFQVLLYDQKLKLKERTRYQSSTQVHIYGRVEIFPFFYKNDVSSGFSFITNPSGAGKYLNPNKDFRETNLLEVYHLKENKYYEIMPVSERPLYKHLDKSIGVIYSPVYMVDRKGSKLYATTSLDNEITVSDLNTNEVTSRIKINHGEFNSLESSPITIKSLPSYNHITLAAKNHKIYNLDGGLIALEYIREIPYGTYEQRKADNPSYHHFSDPSYHKLILFDQKEQLSKDFSIPANGTIKMTLPNSRFLIKIENPDIEEDFIRYSIYKLTKE